MNKANGNAGTSHLAFTGLVIRMKSIPGVLARKKPSAVSNTRAKFCKKV